jgi:hypothetical protein
MARFGVDIGLADMLVALASCERRADFSRPCGAVRVNPPPMVSNTFKIV